MDWGGDLAIWSQARAEFEHAHGLLAQAVTRFEAARNEKAAALAPLILGIELARRRAARRSRSLACATFRLTNGRPLDEVLWSLPDDL
ncbi:MAG TPA: hypothetical protein VFW13_09690 [Phenylobacterium sp.]|nr:hypothetical protein [Phenylobacterium sp.]